MKIEDLVKDPLSLPPFVGDVLEQSPPSEAKIIIMRMGWDGQLPMTIAEIAKVYNVCEHRIRQVEAKFLRKFKMFMTTNAKNLSN